MKSTSVDDIKRASEKTKTKISLVISVRHYHTV